MCEFRALMVVGMSKMCVDVRGQSRELSYLFALLAPRFRSRGLWFRDALLSIVSEARFRRGRLDGVAHEEVFPEKVPLDEVVECPFDSSVAERGGVASERSHPRPFVYPRPLMAAPCDLQPKSSESPRVRRVSGTPLVARGDRGEPNPPMGRGEPHIAEEKRKPR